jgi:glycosyltransferase involved in cell wall biosynthesis
MTVYLPIVPQNYLMLDFYFGFPFVILLCCLAICIAIQLIYYLFVFSRIIFHRNKELPDDQAEPVTLVVCARNELENLRELIPMLDEQDYPEFEILIMNDRSNDGTEEFLQENYGHWAHVRYINISQVYDHITPKKYAITVAVKHARYATVLFTDADCRPTGLQWIRSMMAQSSEPKEIVLGFSPYYKFKGLLNWFIRCETFYAAVQYLSFAKTGSPYMAVGRNLLYQKDLFLNNKGFYKHSRVMGGDDDLFINQVARGRNTAINTDPDSFMYSFPHTTWKGWYKQKTRHLSVSKYYRPGNKLLVGMLSATHVGTWFVFLISVMVGVIWKEYLFLEVAGGLFLLRWLIQWIVLGLINNRLGKTVSSLTFILMDLALFLYYIFMSGIVFTNKQPKIEWR